MKIMLCGKGGCGKSTLSALLAKAFAGQGKQVLVVDEDESNFGLHRQLGLELPKDFTQYFGGKRAVLNAVPKGQPDFSIFDKTWHISDIPAEFLSRKGGISLMSNGKIHEAGEGCACGMGVLSKQFLRNLELAEEEIVILDMEAGVEHFGRGVADFADVILMVMDPSYESLRLCEKVTEMAESIGKPVYYVLNKTDAQSESEMKENMKYPEKIISVMSAEKAIAGAGLRGEELTGEYPAIQKLAERILREKLA